MSSYPSPCDAAPVAGRDELLSLALAVGATDIGIADAMPVDDDAATAYREWVTAGYNGTMDYLDRYDEVRRDPRLLLDGAQSLIVAAFNYMPPTRQAVGRPRFADYALGLDYHEVVRWRLDAMAGEIRSRWGGSTRVCVDTAPLRERYWAMKAGLGFIGRNGQLILPGRGSRFFIGTILTTVRFRPCPPCVTSCDGCGACVRACPGGALSDKGFDGHRCLSYLTIEYRGDFPDGLTLGGRIYGCDVCQDVCPHNRAAKPTDIPEFMPSQRLLDLTRDDIAAMTQEQFSSIFSHSAVKRTKLVGLLRNLKAL
ncbi:MAG: tRNA epoxyqueuosine(34) reductase QueG [Pseudoflavonifractor sp.]|nr:tRNA epoxyqueuosine(34) reductase QueG [Pseudoflavonifractor sp.]